MKRSNRVFLVLTVLAIAVILAGCALGRGRRRSGERLVYASSKSRPEWITQIPEKKNYLFFVGTSPDTSTLDEGKKKAVMDALRQVVNTIGVKVTAESTQTEKYYAEKYKLEVSSKLIEKGEARLQGAVLKEIYYEEYQRPDGSKFYRVWVLVRYDKAQIEKEQKRLKAILQMRYGEVETLEEKAAEAEKRYDFFDAVLYRINAAAAGLKLDEADIFFNRNITKASFLAMKLKMEKINDAQSGWVGESLPKPLKVLVYVEDGSNRHPQVNVPIKFLYKVPRIKSSGYKYLVYRTRTGNDGIASFKIDTIYETSERNEIQAYIDLEPYLKRLKDIPDSFKPAMNQFKTIVKSKKVLFTFKSDTKARRIKTAVYFLQLNVDGSLLPKPVVAPTVFNILYEKKFNVKLLDIVPSRLYKKGRDEVVKELIRTSGKSTRRVLFGFVKILNYDELSGFYIAEANAEVYLYNTGDAELIKSWVLQQSGTGQTKEESQIAVFTEIGKTIGAIASRTMP